MGTDKRARQKAGRQARLAEAEASAAKAESRRKLSRYLVLGAAIVLAVVVVGVFVLGGDDEPDLVVPTTTTAEETEATASTVPGLEEAQEPTCPPEGGTEEPVLQFTEAPPLCIDPTLEHTAVLTTSEGEIRVALDTETTPNTVNNFVFLARWGFYDDTLLTAPIRASTSCRAAPRSRTPRRTPAPATRSRTRVGRTPTSRA
jgi:hypothetical protein